MLKGERRTWSEWTYRQKQLDPLRKTLLSIIFASNWKKKKKQRICAKWKPKQNKKKKRASERMKTTANRMQLNTAVKTLGEVDIWKHELIEYLHRSICFFCPSFIVTQKINWQQSIQLNVFTVHTQTLDPSTNARAILRRTIYELSNRNNWNRHIYTHKTKTIKTEQQQRQQTIASDI